MLFRSDMLRDFFFRYAAGGYNDAGGLVPLPTAKDKLEWIVNEAIQHAAPVPSNSPELHGIAAAPVQAQEPVYQVSKPFPADPANTWRDASSDAYDMSHPDRRRILYRDQKV